VAPTTTPPTAMLTTRLWRRQPVRRRPPPAQRCRRRPPSPVATNTATPVPPTAHHPGANCHTDANRNRGEAAPQRSRQGQEQGSGYSNSQGNNRQ
jgi:hypothetical protein